MLVAGGEQDTAVSGNGRDCRLPRQAVPGARLEPVMSVMGGKDAMEPGFAASEIDTSRPHPARMYDAYLGGNDNYAADRDAVRQVLRAFPEVRAMARANRAFMQRAVRFLAGEAGIGQFVDIGTGIPSAGNVHEVAGQAAPGARVVYVDNDPIVHVHANALLDRQRHDQHRAGRPARPRRGPGAPQAARADRFHPAGCFAAGRDPALRCRGGGPGRDRGHVAGLLAAGQLPRLVPWDGGLPSARRG